ncbi:hypothetical protein [Parachlamydia acanthamoebae]|uniref:hypothetical protein n=1 Tax=Parachlamydia acanthamoebae TaxID=83552 RepID=UPI0024E225F8|nr:hypothetical protein [Parachlamydia acanthamoebae]
MAIHNGKQNHQCLKCGCQFVIAPQNKIISEERRGLIRQSLLERVSLEGICRIFTVNMSWLLQFINEIEDLPENLNATVINTEEFELPLLNWMNSGAM